MSVNVYDIVFVALPVALFLLGYVRGAWRELLTLAGLSAGAVAAGKFGQVLASYVTRVIPDRDFASLIAFVAILVAGYLVGTVLGGITDSRGEAPTSGERLMSAVFGGCKGVVLDLSIFWIVTSYVPAFQAELHRSRVGEAVGHLLKTLIQHSPI